MKNAIAMKYFTEPWHRGELSDKKYYAVIKDYQQYLVRLLPYLPPDVQTLATGISLHDGLLWQIMADQEQSSLQLSLRRGDLQIGYFDLTLHYSQVIFSAIFTEELAGLFAAPISAEPQVRHSQALSNEVDVEGNILVHRILFVSRGIYQGVTVRFSNCNCGLLHAKAALM